MWSQATQFLSGQTLTLCALALSLSSVYHAALKQGLAEAVGCLRAGMDPEERDSQDRGAWVCGRGMGKKSPGISAELALAHAQLLMKCSGVRCSMLRFLLPGPGQD